MPTQSSSPHLPFGENKNAEWYGKDIISVKQFSRKDLSLTTPLYAVSRASPNALTNVSISNVSFS